MVLETRIGVYRDSDVVTDELLRGVAQEMYGDEIDSANIEYKRCIIDIPNSIVFIDEDGELVTIERLEIGQSITIKEGFNKIKELYKLK